MSRDEDLRDRLGHVRWLGGGSGAGKSTVAARLAADHGLRVYATDDAIGAHVARSSATAQPLMHAFRQMTMDERWVTRAPAVMLETFHGFRGEGFEFIVEDLLAMPQDRPILVEGFRVLPRLVAPLLRRVDRAVWLLPTPAFRAAAFEARDTTWRIAGRTSDPARALRNLLARDALFTEQLAAEAAALRLGRIEVDVGDDLESLIDLVGVGIGLRGRADRRPGQPTL